MLFKSHKQLQTVDYDNKQSFYNQGILSHEILKQILTTIQPLLSALLEFIPISDKENSILDFFFLILSLLITSS